MKTCVNIPGFELRGIIPVDFKESGHPRDCKWGNYGIEELGSREETSNKGIVQT